MPCHRSVPVSEGERNFCFRHFVFTLLIFFACLIFAQPGARAQSLDEGQHASTPSPASVLGFTPGDDGQIADWKQITNYFARLDRASDRVLVQTLGTTTLGKPFFVVFVSAPENIRNLATLKEIQRRLADPRTIQNDTDRARLLWQGKTVVAISCSIHSTEIVASQMSMQLAFELASARDTA